MRHVARHMQAARAYLQLLQRLSILSALILSAVKETRGSRRPWKMTFWNLLKVLCRLTSKLSSQ